MTTAPSAPVAIALTTPGPAVGRLALRQVWRGAAVVAVVAAGMSGAVAATYDSVIAGAPGGARALAELAANPAIRTLFGEPVALDEAGGFTVWRVGTVLAVLLATWAALTAVRVLRGEEDAGRWDLLLAGRLPLTAAVTSHLAVLTAAALLAGTAVGGVLLAAGTDPTGALIHGAALGWVGAFFVAVGALAAQLWPDRGSATGAAVTVVVIGLLARMVGDGVAALGWLRWLSPFGLIALARPYDANRVLPLLVLAAATFAVAAGAVLATRRRDLRGGVLPGPRVRRSHSRLLGSVPAFAARSALRPTLAWALGIGAFYLLIGLIAESMTRFLQDNPAFADLARQAGFALDAVEGYAATLFALLTVPVAGFVASRIAALAHAEAARRLDLLLAAPLTRTRLLTTEAAATATATLTLTTVAALTTWAATTISGVPLGLGAALAGAANTLPITALGLGAALLALGWAPRAVLAIGMLPVAGGFLLTVLADSIQAPAWIAALSPFDHLAPVPTTAPDIPAALAMLAIAAGLAAAGLLGYHRRDIRHD